MIPEDWGVSKLKDITALMTNGFVGTVKSHYTDYDNGILYIQGYNVEENSFNFNGIKSVTKEFHKQHSKSCLVEGDLLTIQTGDVGLTTIVPKELTGSNCHALIITRLRKDKAYPKFFSYYLNSFQGRARLKEIETGTTMKHINVGDMIHFLVPIPSLEEQITISNALAEIDKLNQSLERVIIKKYSIKQGAMQNLLRPKEHWEKKTLGEIGTFSKGAGVKKDESLSGKLPCVRYGEIYTRHNDYIKKYYSFISDEVAKTSRKVKMGDILFAGSGETKEDIGKCVAIINDEEVYAGGDIVILTPKGANSLFLGYYLNSPDIVKQKSSKGQGDAVVHIGTRSLEEIEINLPGIEEQAHIATILSDMDSEIAALEAKLNKYRQIKQGMMENLLTGRIRLV
ncbi:restriction endonuclease subunit S [Anaerosolibacter sp.]|uniref:restriction endonuclease subunit S n=1 Tax=Anaerosolibacter sp. TaxID=1872527 RepID=UPI0039EFFCF4